MKRYDVTVKLFQFDEITVEATDKEHARELALEKAVWHGWNEKDAQFEVLDIEDTTDWVTTKRI